MRGASDATYLINSFNEELLTQLQLNVHRLVVVSRTRTRCTRRSVSSVGALAPSTPDGNSAGWRDAPIAGDTGRRYVETYCYAFAGRDFLEDDVQQLYWRTDIVQMTRYT